MSGEWQMMGETCTVPIKQRITTMRCDMLTMKRVGTIAHWLVNMAGRSRWCQQQKDAGCGFESVTAAENNISWLFVAYGFNCKKVGNRIRGELTCIRRRASSRRQDGGAEGGREEKRRAAF